jgi:hypothetical protein
MRALACVPPFPFSSSLGQVWSSCADVTLVPPASEGEAALLAERRALALAAVQAALLKAQPPALEPPLVRAAHRRGAGPEPAVGPVDPLGPTCTPQKACWASRSRSATR